MNLSAFSRFDGIALAGSFQTYAIEGLLQEVVTDHFGDFMRGRSFDPKVIESRKFFHLKAREHRWKSLHNQVDR